MQRIILRQYYILSCLYSAVGVSLLSAVYVTFLMNNGLDLFEVNLVNFTFFFTLFICEIPTGAFADIFGRKSSFVVACALMSLSMFIYGSSSTMAGFIAAEMIGAVGATFKSGAFQAWLVDSLKHHGYTGRFSRIFGREALYCQIGSAGGAIAGAYLAAFHPSIPWYIGSISMGTIALVSWLIMKESYFVPAMFSWKAGFSSLKDITAKSVRYGVKDKAVRFILVVTCILYFAVQSLNMYWQPFFTGRSMSAHHLGYVFAGIMTMIAVGSFIASRMDTAGREKTLIIRTLIMIGILIIATSLAPGLPIAIALFLFHEIPRGCIKPLADDYLQQRIPSKERATIMSFSSIAAHVGGAIGLLASGICAKAFGISVTWMISGMILIIGVLLVAKNGARPAH